MSNFDNYNFSNKHLNRLDLMKLKQNVPLKKELLIDDVKVNDKVDNNKNDDAKDSLNNIISKFISGNLTARDAEGALETLGITCDRSDNQNDRIITFEYDGHSYNITCNKTAANDGFGGKVVETVTKSELTELYDKYAQLHPDFDWDACFSVTATSFKIGAEDNTEQNTHLGSTKLELTHTDAFAFNPDNLPAEVNPKTLAGLVSYFEKPEETKEQKALNDFLDKYVNQATKDNGKLDGSTFKDLLKLLDKSGIKYKVEKNSRSMFNRKTALTGIQFEYNGKTYTFYTRQNVTISETASNETESSEKESSKDVYDENGYDKDGFDKNGFDKDGYDKNGYDKDGYNRNGYDKNGFDIEGFDKDGYDKNGYDKNGYNRNGYDKNGFDIEGFDKDGYDKNGYDKDGFDKNGFDKDGYDKNGYDKDGFDKNGFDKDGYDKNGYDKEGFDVEGIDKDGYNRNGFNADGYDRNGYNKEGFDVEGIDKDGYNRNGFNADGYDRNGYDKDGFDKNGFDKDGYDRRGFDKDGFNKEGYNGNGYDKDGIDRDGYNTRGYKDGYNRNGYDEDGYDKDGYNAQGYDINGYDKDGYDKDGFNKDGIHRNGTTKKVNGVETVINNIDDGYEVIEYKDGTISTKTRYDKNDNVVSVLKYNEWSEAQFFANEYDSNGVRIGKYCYYDNEGKNLKQHSLIQNGHFVSYDMYNEAGQQTQHCDMEYIEALGKEKMVSALIYDPESGTITQKRTYRYNDDGSYSCSAYIVSTGASVKSEYDKDGNKISQSGYSQINKGKISKYGATLTTQQIYNAICGNFDNVLLKVRPLFFSYTFTTREVINYAVNGDWDNEATYTLGFLQAAQAGYNGKPVGASVKYDTYEDTGYSEYVKNRLENALTEDYGYNPEDVKGYLFPTSSDLSKQIASNKDTKDFIKSNISALIDSSGTGLPKNFSFEKANNADLYYSIHGTTCIDSELNGTKLTLTLFDIYDFDQNYINSLTDSSGAGTMLNAAGAAAMKDGKLVPYYMLTKVTIDLKDIYSTSELKRLGIL